MDDQNDEIERHPAAPGPDGFQVFEHMLKLIADPEAFARRMAALKSSLQAVAGGEAKLAAERSAFDEHETAVRAELKKGQSDLQKRRETLAGEEGMLRHHEQVLRDREARLERATAVPDDWSPPVGSTMSRNNPNRGLRLAPDGLPFPNNTTITCGDSNPLGRYVETDQNKLPMRKDPPPRARSGRGRRISA